MTYKPCPRCKRLIPAGLSYCPECRPIAEAEWEATKEHNARLRERRYNRSRDHTGQIAQFRRSKAWKDTSKSKLQSCGYKCEANLDGCGHIACEVHHVKPLKTREGWERRLDWSNLMGVCVACHNKLDNKGFKRYNEEGIIDMRKVER